MLWGLLLAGDGVGMLALRGLGVDVEALREEMREPAPRVPMTPESFILAVEAREKSRPTPETESMLALGATDDFFDTGHLLLGLLRHGVAVRGVTVAAAEAEIGRQMAAFLSGRATPADPATADELIGKPRVRVPDDIRELGRRIDDLRREKERAVDAEEFDRAGQVREQEKELLADRRRRVAAWAADVDLLAVVKEVEALRAEVDNLRNP